MFVLYDSEAGQYKRGWSSFVVDPKDAKQYKRKGNAIKEASLRNTNRNVPKGCTPNKYYQNRPQMEVVEFDTNWNQVQVHAAPPSYIYL